MDYESLRLKAKDGLLTTAIRRALRKAAQSGDADSQYFLACGDRNSNSRLKWLRAAASQGHPEACCDLYDAEGDIQALRRAANLGWPPAQALLGTILATGEGPLPKNLKLARKWYLQSSRSGFQEAWYETGFMLLLGEGGPAEPEQAIEWLEKAAASDACQADDASRLLADLLQDGSQGVPKDPLRSQFWRQRYEELDNAALDWTAANIHALRIEDGPGSPSSQTYGHLLARFTKRFASFELAEILLSRGADPNVALDSRSTWAGSTALSWSTRNPELVKLLVSAGARVSAECTQNRIISLHEACLAGDLDTVRLLMEKADGVFALLVTDQHQRTPLIHAAHHGHLPIVEYLLSLGPVEESALEVALHQNHQEVAELLRSAIG